MTFIIGDASEHTHTGCGAATVDVVIAIRVAEALSGAIGAAFVKAMIDTDIAEYSTGAVAVD